MKKGGTYHPYYAMIRTLQRQARCGFFIAKEACHVKTVRRKSSV
jgi:hypothetical protein